MNRLIELGAARIGAEIQNLCTNVDFEVLALPGGSLIAALLSIYAIAESVSRLGVLKRRCAATR
jgi:hypothetical protein